MNNKLSRRSFLSGSAAALATVSIAPMVTSCQTAPAGPTFPSIYDFGSKFGGVQIGAITYSWRSMPAGLENIVKYCKESGISSVELMSDDLETFLGRPENPIHREPQQPSTNLLSAGSQMTFEQMITLYYSGFKPLTPQEQEIQDKYDADVKVFRMSVSSEKIAAAKKLFDDAGIGVHIVKFSPSGWSDEEIDYAFTTAKAMGAKAVCEEISERAVAKLAPFAEKHGMYAIFHNHQQYAEEGFSADPFLTVSPAVMLNFDAGHYFGSTGLNPCDFIRKYHERIYSIHIKDKTGLNTEPSNNNQVWGQGETPLAELLLLIKNEAWPIYLDIELEYRIPSWSNAVKEVRTCVQYARNILI